MNRPIAVIVGSDGLVGAALSGLCRARGLEVVATSRRGTPGTVPLDLASPDLAALPDRADLVFLCAAVTDMRACQADAEDSRRVNVDGTLQVLRSLSARGARGVFLSSSQVFDGETPAPAEECPTRPKNVYGAQKVAVERAVAVEGLPVAVLRVSKVLAERPVGMFKGWFEALGAGREIEAASNMTLSPVTVAEVAAAAFGLAAGGADGLWHLSAGDEIVYAEAARRMAEIHGLEADKVRAVPVSDAVVPAIFRHRHATLDSRKIERRLGLARRPSVAVLDELFRRFPRPGGGR